MKKLYILLTLLTFTLGLSAQKQYRIWRNGESTRFTMATNPTIVYNPTGTADDAPTLVIGDSIIPVSTIDSICIVHRVDVVYDGSSATVRIPAAVAADVSAQIEGAYVTITNTNVFNEMEFVLSGSSSDGAFIYNGSYKSTIRLNGLTLTSQKGAAIDIQCGKRLNVMLEEGTVNTLSDSATGEQKGCFYCKGHVEMEGSGTLNVTGNVRHAIAVKEYMQVKKTTGTINILKSAGDAIHVGQYYQHNGGTVNITSTTQGDGIQVETMTLEDDVTIDPEKEYNGQIFIKGGKLNITASHEDCKGIKCDGLITVSGGTFDITASGNGSRGIQTDGSMIIGDEDNATSITIRATGAECTNTEHSDDPHRCMGIKVDGNLTVNGGTTVVTNTGKKSRGIKVGGVYKKNGGTVTANIKN